jgi:acetyl-CoA carboxylase biotin carboxyl carrier protein
MNMKDGNGPKKPQGPIDATAIRELAELLTETGLTEIEIEQNGQRLRVARQAAQIAMQPVQAAPSPAPAVEAPSPKRESHAGAVTSPMVGTVYVAPEPGRPAFVHVGDKVKEGDTLLIVEAMKTMNPILAPRAGTIGEICIQDGQPVEFGQALVILN